MEMVEVPVKVFEHLSNTMLHIGQNGPILLIGEAFGHTTSFFCVVFDRKVVTVH